MPPEQITKRGVDRRADIFAMGCVLFEATVGRVAFGGDSAFVTMYQILEGEVEAPSHLLPDYPKELERIVLKAMSREPDGRHATAEDLRVELESWLAQSGAPVTELELGAWVKSVVGASLKERQQAIRTAAESMTDAGIRGALEVEASSPSAPGGGPASAADLRASDSGERGAPRESASGEGAAPSVRGSVLPPTVRPAGSRASIESAPPSGRTQSAFSTSATKRLVPKPALLTASAILAAGGLAAGVLALTNKASTKTASSAPLEMAPMNPVASTASGRASGDAPTGGTVGDVPAALVGQGRQQNPDPALVASASTSGAVAASAAPTGAPPSDGRRPTTAVRRPTQPTQPAVAPAPSSAAPPPLRGKDVDRSNPFE
jgi:serine/threonine-protein kinase